MKSYKEVWQEYFDTAREAGHDEDGAGRIADEQLADDAAAQVDRAHDAYGDILRTES